MDSEHHRGYSDPNRDFLDTSRHSHRARWRYGWAKAMDCHRFDCWNRGNRAAGVRELASWQCSLIKPSTGRGKQRRPVDSDCISRGDRGATEFSQTRANG